MRILVINDDGIYAPGLWALATELKKIAEITVVAPDREQSGIGAAITLHYPLRLQKVNPEIPGVKSYTVGGTPGDSVILAINLFGGNRFDLAVSGVNNGPNLGVDIFQSGTVGGALQAFLHGLPSIAVSIDGIDNPYMDIAARFTLQLVSGVLEDAAGLKYLLNVNVPGLPVKQIRGVKTTRFITTGLADTVEEGHDGRRQYYWLKYKKIHGDGKSRVTDAWAVSHGYISITPLHKLLFGQKGPSFNSRFAALMKGLPST
jgi:5'-nucleotidase